MADLFFKHGVMGSGKTTELLQAIYNYKKNNLNIILIKPKLDKKGEDSIVSRLGDKKKVDILLDSNEKIIDRLDLNNLKCILVDESQFLTKKQVKELWLITKIHDIPVICYGLMTDFKGEFFIGSKTLMELSDQVSEITTICSCGEIAKFSARKINGEYTLKGDVVAIDKIDAEYEALCPKCYIKKVLKKKKV